MAEKTYVIAGYCLVPHAARIEVRAHSEAEAMKLALKAWNKDKSALIDQGDGDTDAAFDWDFSLDEVRND